uniref:Uncharacterized protein n=1 Tax=Arundo donax TaxID=35708 RepID=A0A0A8YTA0_ARUDO
MNIEELAKFPKRHNRGTSLPLLHDTQPLVAAYLPLFLHILCTALCTCVTAHVGCRS